MMRAGRSSNSVSSSAPASRGGEGESLEEIKLRGDIYLSRVLILRDAPALAELRERMLDQNLTRLFQSAQETERLLAGLDRLENRDALLWHLRTDAGMIRLLTFELLKLDRKITGSSGTGRTGAC
jgi:hypothetical protein